jgi:hypothetical protein
MLGRLLTQVARRSERSTPLALTGRATSCALAPNEIVAALGDTVTALTGIWVAVMRAVALLPSLAAVIVAAPGDSAVTRPVDETVAIAGALELQVTLRPVRTTPVALVVVAVSFWLCPTRIVAVDGVIATEATGAR